MRLRKILSVVLCLTLLCGLVPTAFAVDDPAKDAADQLDSLGLFNGTGTDENGDPIYDLDRAPNRYEAITMLVRLLGKEQEALNGTWETPFTDVASWAKPYVGYAYAHGLTSGVSATAFGGTQKVSATQYLTFVLRALGYDSSKDFKWNAAWELSDKLGLTNGQFNSTNNNDFLRGDVALISYDALDICVKDTSTPLISTIPLPEPKPEPAPEIGTYSVDYNGGIPVETGPRNISDADLKALSGKTPEAVAASITTLADAYAWLAQEGYSTTGMLSGDRKQSCLINGTARKNASWLEMSTILNTLLDGDYDETGTLLCATPPLESGWAYFYISFNYVKSGEYYYITDPLCHLNNSGWAVCRAYTIKTDSLYSVKDALSEINDDFAPVTLAVFPLNTKDVTVSFHANPMHITFPSLDGIEYLFQANGEDFDRYQQEQEQEQPPSQETGAYSVDYTGGIPAETGARKISDAELKSLSGKTPEAAAASITTLADAYAWLAQEGYTTTGMDGINGVENGILNGTGRKDVSWLEMSTILNTLLDGDYDETGTLLCATLPLESGWAYFYISFNYVKSGEYYYITDPLCHLDNSGWAVCRAYTIKTDSLHSVKDALSEINADFAPVTLAVFPLNTENVTVSFHANPMHITFPSLDGIEYLFQANGEDFDRYQQEQEAQREKEMAQWASTARNIRISRYNMPTAIGNTTLTYDSAYALVGKDPAVIADNVKTVADVLQYMIASRFGYYSDYFGTPWYDSWGFDAPGDYQIQENYGCCCGGYANAVSFLLQGDYEKVGTLRWVGGGNHTISWVYTGGKYYVFDFTQYCSGGNYNKYNCPVTVLDRLEDFYDQMPDTYSYFPKSEIVIMVAFEAGAAMYPSNWSDPPCFTGLTFPKEAEGKITLIYQKDSRYGVKFRDVDIVIPGWNDN